MIKDKFSTKKPLLSFEVFPPKKEGDFESVYQTLDELKKLNPDFISVTYGAGGSKSKKTAEIASYIQNTLSLDALAHMTCVGNKKEDILEVCRQLQEANVSHVLALRGDRPATMTDEQYEAREFMYASELIQFLKTSTDFSISGACYPEKHFEAFSKETDLTSATFSYKSCMLKSELSVSRNNLSMGIFLIIFCKDKLSIAALPKLR